MSNETEKLRNHYARLTPAELAEDRSKPLRKWIAIYTKEAEFLESMGLDKMAADYRKRVERSKQTLAGL